MTKSVFVYSILFTLEDRDVSSNTYINMYVFWLSALLKTKSLDANDALYLFIDEITFNELRAKTSFERIAIECPCKITIHLKQRPKTLTEGFMWKFSNDIKYHTSDIYKQDVLFYTDIDVLITRPFKHIFEDMADDTLYGHVEGILSNDNYGAGLAAAGFDVANKENSAGFSAGKFMLTGPVLRKTLFDQINDNYARDKTPYYTCDQIYFNNSIYYLSHKQQINVDCVTLKSWQYVHRQQLPKDVFLIDCCGIPGDKELHLVKVMDTYVYSMHFYQNEV